MKILVVSIFLLFTNLSYGQTVISGKVVDKKGMPVMSANVYLEGTYDGSTTSNQGEFRFSTDEKGTHTLVVSYVSFETFTLQTNVSIMTNLHIVLKDDVNALDAVVLSAGSFSAGDNSKINALKPLDVVTTASALGDFVGALQTLPGTTTVAEDGRLFVRGGDADETQIFIDGIRVFTPYSPTTNNTPTRGRYSPFLFDGITFSTGGYSAEFGQALSSVLLLNTIDEPDQEKTDIGIMTVGATLGNTQKWERSSISVNGSYINLAPYIGLFPDRNDWKKPFETLAGETVFRQQFDNGLLKLYAAFDTTNFELTQEDINFEDGIDFKLKNDNLYLNGSIQTRLDNDWSLFGGLSYTYANEDLNINDAAIRDQQHAAHIKFKLKKRFSNRFKLYVGSDYFLTDFKEQFGSQDVSEMSYGFNNGIAATYLEADVIFSKKFASKIGVRSEYTSLFQEATITPRMSLAYKTSDKSQLSFAYGIYYQNPSNAILKFNQNVRSQNTSHYLLNYQYNADGRIFRAEVYFKDYDNLIKYDDVVVNFNSSINNNGFGYAKGIDIFWRDNKSIKNLDYWLSYSYLDSKRNYRNFPSEAQPNFANTHNLSVVGKYFITDWKSQVGLSYAFGSGRTYTNPNSSGFLNEMTKPFNSLSFNWAYLVSQQKILYFSVNNVFGFNNINGYQYADVADASGTFDRRTLRPAADQFFFIGFFWTISDDKTSNQLDNL